jgi:ElaA protein
MADQPESPAPRPPLRWYDRELAALAPAELYGLLALRARVFVVEQACAYLDLDGVDASARHLWAARGEPAAVVACLRVVPAGVKYPEVSLGRVVTAPEERGTGLGRELMQRGIALAGAVPIRIGAQAYLERFYAGLGFVRVSDNYLEDGIPHLEMLRAPDR